MTGDRPAAKPRRGLGMGLSALLGDRPEGPVADGLQTQTVPIELLGPSPLQPRRRFAEAELEALAQSIREKGVLQPLLVRPAAAGATGYEIVAGERRWRAAQRALLHEVPVVVRELDDGQTLELALIENVQRSDLSAIEEAEAYRRLIEQFGHTQEALAGTVGKSRSHVANTLRLLGLPEAVRLMVQEGALTAGHARALIGAADPGRLADLVVERQLSVRETEALARREQGAARAPRVSAGAPDPNLADLERQLSQSLGLAVTIRTRGEGGVLMVRYSQGEQLAALLARMG